MSESGKGKTKHASNNITMVFSLLPTDLVAGCLCFLAPADVCRAGRASRPAHEATTLAFGVLTKLSVVKDAPFVNDNGLRHLLRRCPVLVDIDIDARRLTDAGAAAIAETLPRLTGLNLRNGYGLSGIGCITAASAAAAVATRGAGWSGEGATGRGVEREATIKGTRSARSARLQQAVASTSRASFPAGRRAEQQRPRMLHLRSLSLCSLGPCEGLGNPSPEQFEDWCRLAEACSPFLRALTLTNVSAGQLPLCALTPFFKYPRIRAAAIPATAAGAADNASGTCVNSVPVFGRGGSGGSSAKDEEGRSDGLEELALATVSSKLAATVLRGVKRPIPLCFRGEGGASFPGGPRPPLVGLKYLNLVVDAITDALCSAIAEGCPNVREVSLRQRYGEQVAFSDASPMALARCQQLTSLSLMSDHQRLRGCSDVGLVFMVMNLVNLEQLVLCGVSRATDTTAAAILDHPQCRLRQLRLEGCEQLEGHVFIQPLIRTPQSARRLMAMSVLTSVSLAHCTSVTPEALEALIEACGPCLESLNLLHCCVTDDVLVPIFHLPGLRELNLCGCPFTDEGITAACSTDASGSAEGNETVAVGMTARWPYGQHAACNDCDDDRQYETGALSAGVGDHHRQHQVSAEEGSNRNTVINDIVDNATVCGRNKKCEKAKTKKQQQAEECERGKIINDTGGAAPNPLLPLPPPLPPPSPARPRAASDAHDGDKYTNEVDVHDAEDKPALDDSNQERRQGEPAGGRADQGHGRAAAAAATATAEAARGVGRQRGGTTGGRGGLGGFGAGEEGGFETGEGTVPAVTAAKRPCARAPSAVPLPPQQRSPPSGSSFARLAAVVPRRQQKQQQQQQQLRKLSLAWCHGVRGSGVIALVKSGRLGRHTRSFDGRGLRMLEDRHVEVLLAAVPLLQKLRLSYCELLTRSTVAFIVRSACGSSTLSVLDLRRCHGIHATTLALIRPPSLPALVRLAWWGDNEEAEIMAASARGGNCWVIPESG